MGRDAPHRCNRMLMSGLFGLVFAMVGLSFAAVPLYDLFCRVTGYGGTTQVSDVAPTLVLDREVRVRFAAATDRDLPWGFAPQQREMVLKVGESGMAFFSAENHADRPITGMAVFNVAPAKAGLYFNKIQCFCFDEQTLAPGQVVSMPVYFFVDPAIDEDPNLDEVRTITLSYTFFRSASDSSDAPSGGVTESEDRAADAGIRSTIVAAASGR